MSKSELAHSKIPADASGLRRPGVSNQKDSKNINSVPMTGSSRLYPANKGNNTGGKKTETQTGKTSNPLPDRSQNSTNGETKPNRSTNTTTTTTTSQGSDKGHGGVSPDTNPRSLNPQNRVEGLPNRRARNDEKLSFSDSEIFDAVAQSLSGLSVSAGNSVKRRWKGRTGNEGHDEEEEDDDLTSDMSTPTSGYATDRSTDHFRHDDGRTIVVRAFETPAFDEGALGPGEQHPYFARLAAEAEDPTPILSRSGSLRGVKNRVRAGIASLLDKSDGKKSVNYSLLEKGKVVFYTTSVTVVRETSDRCHRIKRILQTQMVEFDERDVSMSKECHLELADRLHPDVELPQVFVDGHHLGGPEEIERLNESGTLRKIFKNFTKVQQTLSCRNCGGFRFVPCTSCRGSKKSKRNCFTDEFCALRCTKCDDNGLVKCNVCNSNNGNVADDCEPRQEE